MLLSTPRREGALTIAPEGPWCREFFSEPFGLDRPFVSYMILPYPNRKHLSLSDIGVSRFGAFAGKGLATYMILHYRTVRLDFGVGACFETFLGEVFATYRNRSFLVLDHPKHKRACEII